MNGVSLLLNSLGEEAEDESIGLTVNYLLTIVFIRPSMYIK